MMAFIDVREPHTKKLLFRYDPSREIIEIQERKVKTVVDLRQYQAPESAEGASDGRQGEQHQVST